MNTCTDLIVFTNCAASRRCLHPRVKFCTVMIYITFVAQLDGEPRECNIRNESTRNSTTPYPISEQVHDVLITNSQTYSYRLSVLCPFGVIILDDKSASPNESFVSITFFCFGLVFCIIFEESLLKL